MITTQKTKGSVTYMTHFAGKAARVLVLSAVFTLLLAASAMAADVAVGVGATTGSSLRMRAEASTSSSIVTTLDKSVAVAVLDDSIDGWYKINYAGNVGYVSADYLVIDQDNIFESYGSVNTDGVNVRSGAFRQRCAGLRGRRHHRHCQRL